MSSYKTIIFPLLFSFMCVSTTMGGVTVEERDMPTQEEEYAIIVLEAQWCQACPRFKRSFKNRIVQHIIKKQYEDIYFVDVDHTQEKEMLKSYKHYLKTLNQPLVLPTTFIVWHKKSAKHWEILRHEVGSMSDDQLIQWLDRPIRYKKRRPIRRILGATSNTLPFILKTMPKVVYNTITVTIPRNILKILEKPLVIVRAWRYNKYSRIWPSGRYYRRHFRQIHPVRPIYPPRPIYSN